MALDETNKELYELEASALIELFELDLSSIGGSQSYYFHAGTNGVGGDIVWGPNDQIYIAAPITVNGFEMDGSGGMPRPTMLVSNVGGVFSALLDANEDLIGAQVKRRRTFSKFLNAVNFPEGENPTEDKYQEFPIDIYIIEQKKAENPDYIEFELASILDTENLRLPNRQIHANFCDIRYRSLDCGYAGPPVTDSSGNEFFPDKGDWVNGGSYAKWDKVRHNDKQWVANQANGQAPSEVSIYWDNILDFSRGVWVSGATYTQKQYVVSYRDGVPFVFVSKANGNTGNQPPDAAWWDVDICNKKLSGCKLRFGPKGPFPAALFPGTAQYF